jgi:type 2 lantibiotic biosynthesis protein LanM
VSQLTLSADWYRATTLAERVASLDFMPSPEGEENDELARLGQADWAGFPQLQDNCFATYLLACNFNRSTFLHVLKEPLEAVRDRLVLPPRWLNDLCAAFRDAATSRLLPFKELLGGHDVGLLLHLVEPLIWQATDRLHAALAPSTGDTAAPFDITQIESGLLANVARRVLDMLLPVAVLELNVARVRGTLPGDTPEQRFESFAALLRYPNIALGILREYPTLARQVIGCLDHWVTFVVEFLGRLGADWRDLCSYFCAGQDPGTLVSLDDTKGDQHQAGRSVLILTFSSGFRLVYKPRPLAVAKHFQEFLGWLNARGAEPRLQTIKILDCGAYGWVEFVAQQGCTTSAEVSRFYARQGAYLAILYALEGTDFHYENLIAVGEHPILVDLETLFQPRITDIHRVGEAYKDSVLRLGLLPQRMFGGTLGEGIDLSGLGAAAGQALPYTVPYLEAPGTDRMRLVHNSGKSSGADNQPSLAGRNIDILDYADEITQGFSTLYRLMQTHREELLSRDGPLARFVGDTVRVVLRPTLTYGMLLRSSFHPNVLRDALDRDMLLGSLWGQTQGRIHLERIFPFEISDLHNRDIPLFTTCTCSRDLSSSSGHTFSDFFTETGMSNVHRRLCQFGESDYQRQAWFIRASLATTARQREPAPLKQALRSDGRSAPRRQRLLAAANAIGERLHDLALHDRENVSWIGLTLTGKDNWSLVPLGLDLYNGLPGVALFLSYLGEVSQKARYTRLARKTVNTFRRQFAASSLNSFSIGAFEGLGGLVFVLAHLGVLWEDSELLEEAARIVEGLRPLIFYDRKFDIVGGAAGAIMGCAALYRVVPDEGILAAAIECGDHLLLQAERLPEVMAWPAHFPAKGPLTGLAHGASGIALALLELASLSGEVRFKRAALEAFSYERSLFSGERKNWPDLRTRNAGEDDSFMVGWCHGAPGITLTRLQALRQVDDPILPSEIAAGLETTLSDGFRGDHCLCHGCLGNVESLIQAREVLSRYPWSDHVDRIAAAILRSIDEDGWSCGVPLGVETPGLMTGLAGIGYGLLRLAEPSMTRSILTLEPP